jgi:hypothetical protein
MPTAVEAAEAEAAAGAREVGGNNAGPWCEKYLNADHPERITRRGLPWCVGFVLWCWMQAGPLPFAWTLSAGALWEHLPRKDRVSLPGTLPQMEPGYVLFWNYHADGTDAPSHVNMVHHVGDGTIYTIGGNEGDEASGAPVKVKPRHDLSKLWGVGRVVA